MSSENSDLLKTLEAILFASAAPVTEDVLRAYLQIEDDALQPLLTELQSQYAERGIHLIQRDARWIFETAPELKDRLQFVSEKPRRLSRAAIETLAIVAYHQPVTRAEIESIRAVAVSSGTLDVLMEAGWIKPGRRRETPGRPLTFITTPEFLDHYGLENLKDLPGLEELKASGLLDARAAIAAIPDMEQDNRPEMEEEQADLSDFISEDSPDAVDADGEAA